jgi:hypothetical protein
MTENRLPTALDPDAIFGKAKLYIGKALARKEAEDLDEYQLWASLALELLGKAALAKIHPSLIVDPNHSESLIAASGIKKFPDIKTITAKTLFERLQKIISHFDEKTRDFCLQIALRRNAELHSGEAAFSATRQDALEAKYWHACQIILDYMGSSLEDWLGASQAQAPKAIIKHAAEAKQKAVTVRVERAKEAFHVKPKSEQKKILEEAEGREEIHYKNLFTLLGDHEWECRCPACGGKAFLAGIRVDEDVVNTYGDEDGVWEQVEIYYSAEQFRCPVCRLALDGSDEIEYADLSTEHSKTEEREMEYEPDYGND